MCDEVEVVRVGDKLVDVDLCLAPLVKALNSCGMETVASCCGHNKQPGNIVLADGREIIITKNYEQARAIGQLFPAIADNDAETCGICGRILSFDAEKVYDPECGPCCPEHFDRKADSK